MLGPFSLRTSASFPTADVLWPVPRPRPFEFRGRKNYCNAANVFADENNVSLGLRLRLRQQVEIANSQNQGASVSFFRSCEREQGKQDAFESELASSAVKPFLQRRRCQRDCFAAERQRNIGIGGSALHLRRIAELCSSRRA